ncbi:MAG: hypothetical protein HQM12_23035 [SAR324 cluster bacterium]|nr:hypothetical protein [SAR324 cluster bacterium]
MEPVKFEEQKSVDIQKLKSEEPSRVESRLVNHIKKKEMLIIGWIMLIIQVIVKMFPLQ